MKTPNIFKAFLSLVVMMILVSACSGFGTPAPTLSPEEQATKIVADAYTQAAPPLTPTTDVVAVAKTEAADIVKASKGTPTKAPVQGTPNHVTCKAPSGTSLSAGMEVQDNKGVWHQCQSDGSFKPPFGAADTEKLTATPPSSAITSTKVITSTGETFSWIWSNKGGINTQNSPKLLDNGSYSTGNGKEDSYDIGVKSDEFAIVKGKKVSYNSVTSGNNLMCGLMGFGPGYHYNVTGTDARYEVYVLPTGGNWKEWAQVLIDQASKVDQKEYGCPAKALKDVTVFFKNESAPFNALSLVQTKK